LSPKTGSLLKAPFTLILRSRKDAPIDVATAPSLEFVDPSEANPLPQLVEEATYLLKLGVKELILVGQDTTLYGRDLGEKDGLLKLLYSLSELPFEFRIRVLYLHPQHVDENLLLSMLSIPKVLPYFELPIQHAHPKILKAMNRAYSPEKILKLISSVRQATPRATFRSTVIVGFPGEGG
jgi:ribosomal protein S12 methylthiotransferase